jgi:hypothetical protein
VAPTSLLKGAQRRREKTKPALNRRRKHEGQGHVADPKVVAAALEQFFTEE